MNFYYTSVWEVYVGGDLLYSNNPRCEGGPFLKSTYDDYSDTFGGLASAASWQAYGFEAKCNLSGRYTFLVAFSVPRYSVTVCTVAVMGTRYVRDNAAPEWMQI